MQKICIRKKQEGLHHEACSLRKTENMRKLVRLLCSFCSMERKDCATQLFHTLSTQIIRQITPFVRRKLNEKLRPYDISVSDTTPELFITDMQVQVMSCSGGFVDFNSITFPSRFKGTINVSVQCDDLKIMYKDYLITITKIVMTGLELQVEPMAVVGAHPNQNKIILSGGKIEIETDYKTISIGTNMFSDTLLRKAIHGEYFLPY